MMFAEFPKLEVHIQNRHTSQTKKKCNSRPPERLSESRFRPKNEIKIPFQNVYISSW